MNKKIINEVDLVIDSTNIAGALEGLRLFTSELTVNSLKRNDLNILNGLIAAIACLAKQHSDDVVHFESEVPVNE